MPEPTTVFSSMSSFSWKYRRRPFVGIFVLVSTLPLTTSILLPGMTVSGKVSPLGVLTRISHFLVLPSPVASLDFRFFLPISRVTPIIFHPPLTTSLPPLWMGALPLTSKNPGEPGANPGISRLYSGLTHIPFTTTFGGSLAFGGKNHFSSGVALLLRRCTFTQSGSYANLP